MPLLLAADVGWLDQVINTFADLFPAGSFFSEPHNLRGVLALILVSLCCGVVGSLVVGGRMSFFSDAVAHCAFAGVCLGFLVFSLFAPAPTTGESDVIFWRWVTTVMIAFGALIGCGIAYVRSETGLASDTVIGVFFAGCIGLAAALKNLLRKRVLFNMEEFLFGDPSSVSSDDLTWLAALLVLTLLVMTLIYNTLLLGSFNHSLAVSRRMPVRRANYVFVALLAVIINVSLRSVGVLLINGLLIVPAAAALNIARNQRQVFWWTLGVTQFASLGGRFLSWEADAHKIPLGTSGTIVLLSVVVFAASLFIARKRRRAGA
jgi:zinc transport system permease protein